MALPIINIRDIFTAIMDKIDERAKEEHERKLAFVGGDTDKVVVDGKLQAIRNELWSICSEIVEEQDKLHEITRVTQYKEAKNVDQRNSVEPSDNG